MTSKPNKTRLEAVINAACELAKLQGLKFDKAIALQDQSSLVVRLRRIATITGWKVGYSGFAIAFVNFLNHKCLNACHFFK